MNFPIKFKKVPVAVPGFTLAEVLVVITILITLSGVSVAVYNAYRVQQYVEIAALEIAEAIRMARFNAQNGKSDSLWGVYLNGRDLVVFKGVNYVSRDASADEYVRLPGGVAVSGFTEVVFQKVTGFTSSTGSFTVSGQNRVKNVSLNEKGIVSY